MGGVFGGPTRNGAQQTSVDHVRLARGLSSIGRSVPRLRHEEMRWPAMDVRNGGAG
jgi:hypothetical protein